MQESYLLVSLLIKNLFFCFLIFHVSLFTWNIIYQEIKK